MPAARDQQWPTLETGQPGHAATPRARRLPTRNPQLFAYVSLHCLPALFAGMPMGV